MPNSEAELLSSILHPRFRNGILRSKRHPGHATKKSRGRQPKPLGKTMALHRLFRVGRARGVESAADEAAARILEEQPIAFDDDDLIECH